MSRTYCMSASFVGDVLASTTNERVRNRQSLEEGERAALVEHVVEVAALRALDAGGAAIRARAAADQRGGVGDPALELLEAALRDPDAAGVAVVDEDGRPSGLRVDVGGEAADVPAVAHRPERQER